MSVPKTLGHGELTIRQTWGSRAFMASRSPSTEMAAGNGTGLASLNGARSRLPVRLEVLPDLLEHLRIDDPPVALFWTRRRMGHERHGSAMRPEGAGLEHIEPFVDRGA